eukprot:scaffold27786_cov146-Skeletonema_marinoi.AAC.4
MPWWLALSISSVGKFRARGLPSLPIVLRRIFTETKWVLLESLLFIYLSWGDPWGKYRKSSEDRGSYPENNT